MIKKIALLLIVALCSCASMHAQDLERAQEYYKEFVRLNRLAGDKDSMYTALLKGYNEYLSIVHHSSGDNAIKSEAIKGVQNFYRFLPNGAAYYQSKNKEQALVFAKEFVDLPMSDNFKNDQTLNPGANYPILAYFVAAHYFNNKDFQNAITYFQYYLATGDEKNRQAVYGCLAQSCIQENKLDWAKTVLQSAVDEFPGDYNMLTMAINVCIKTEDYTNFQNYLTKALDLHPNDKQLLGFQGKLYEDTQEFEKAIQLYGQLQAENPASMEYTQHLALNYFNQGVLYYNKATSEQAASTAKRYQHQARDFFEASISLLENVLDTNPNQLKYAQALAVAYGCVGNGEKLAQMNTRIQELGGQSVSASDVPVMMTYSGAAVMAQNEAKPAEEGQGGLFSGRRPVLFASDSESAPPYSQFAREYVEGRIRDFEKKDPYETVEEYKKRLTDENRAAKVRELQGQAQENYIKLYARNPKLADLKLNPYDAENRVFLVESEKYGDMIIPVPREHNEAKQFETSWNGIQLKNPKFCIADDQIAILALTFVTPTGNSYTFDRTGGNVEYAQADIHMNFDEIDYSTGITTQNVRRNSLAIEVGSDVDNNIPEVKKSNARTFAVVIANEHYNMVAPVPYANNDGNVFARYCEKTLGLPKENIRLYNDATYGVMVRAMRDISSIAEAYNDINVIFYYAGHGIPDESTKDAFLLPIDAEGTQTEGCYPLTRLYNQLGSLGAKSVVVFLDACFSGAQRNGEMLASARGIALRAKNCSPQGNMVVFSAASGDETAFPYTEKNHGMFTYFLLKKLQETKGNVNLKSLSDYVTQRVKEQAIVINRKPQTPTVSSSSSMLGIWEKLKMRP